MWSVLAVSLVIAQIVSVENAVLLEETTTGRSHTINKVGRGDIVGLILLTLVMVTMVTDGDSITVQLYTFYTTETRARNTCRCVL